MSKKKTTTKSTAEKIEIIQIINTDDDTPQECFRTDTEMEDFVSLARQIEGNRLVIGFDKVTPKQWDKIVKNGNVFA